MPTNSKVSAAGLTIEAPSRRLPSLLVRMALAALNRKKVRIACLAGLQLATAFAWVFPEHRDIAVLAIQRLDADQRARLQELWAAARVGHESRLCGQTADPTRGPKPSCIDYAAWTAISGDHSCSARDMLGTVLDAPWILGVERVCAKLQVELAAATRPDQRANAVRDSDLALTRTDPGYVTRASSGNAHFLLARPNVAMEPVEYARLALGPDADLNAVAIYLWYHLRALATAGRADEAGLTPEARAQVVRAALADEAFGLHFLEDSFAGGHATGTWGKAAVRKGTHDYYNEHGVSLVAWNGHPFVAMGDANMRPEDAERTALAVRDSLAQLLDVFDGKAAAATIAGVNPSEAEGFDVCKAPHFSGSPGGAPDLRAVAPILMQTPVPGSGEGLGELPRFRGELGLFVGLTTALRAGALNRGFADAQTDASGTAGLEAAVRLGLGLEGVINQSSDGLIFVQFGGRVDRRASGVATLPGRSAISARLRMPFWLVPGDLLVLGPVLALTSPHWLGKTAVNAANGGLIPWQAGIATRIGRFQFVLGREVGLTFYHNNSSHPILMPTPGVVPLGATLVALNSVQVEIPILEYRLFRSFARDQSAGLMIQPHVGFDTPTSSSAVSPEGAPAPHLRTVVTAGVRVVFDWRHYLK